MTALDPRAARFALAVAVSAGMLLAAEAALAQSPPTFQQYPLRDRVFGPGGAIFPDYVTPSEYGVSFMIGGGGSRSAVFAAGTSDYNCQQTQIPTIQVLSAPPGGKVSIQYGRFVATGIDGGHTTKCIGQPAKGLIVSYKGKAAPGSTLKLRVTYPPRGEWYDHVVAIPPR